MTYLKSKNIHIASLRRLVVLKSSKKSKNLKSFIESRDLKVGYQVTPYIDISQRALFNGVVRIHLSIIVLDLGDIRFRPEVIFDLIYSLSPSQIPVVLICAISFTLSCLVSEISERQTDRQTDWENVTHFSYSLLSYAQGKNV